MIELEVYNNIVKEDNKKIPVYSFKSCYKINILMGDSGSGKSLFFSCMENALRNTAGWFYKCNKKVETVSSIDVLENYVNTVKEHVFIMDEDIVQVILKRKLLNKITKTPNYFIIIDRGLGSSLETNVKALFKIESTNKSYKGIKLFSIKSFINMRNTQESSENISNKFNMLLTEDSESGRKFFQELLDKLELYSGITDSCGRYLGGRDKIIYYLEGTLKSTHNNVVIALDYDTASNVIIDIIDNDSIDKKRILFINMESFEEIICNSEFILSKFPEMRDKVINYQNYIDASYKHTGKYFSDLLFTYVKVKSPLKEYGERNATKFYEKGMKNFKQCFIRDCCDYNINDCKLYTNKNKKLLMLCNKFEGLRVFSNTDNKEEKQ